MIYEKKIKTVADADSLYEQLIKSAEEASKFAQVALKYRSSHYFGPADMDAMRNTRTSLIEKMSNMLAIISVLQYKLDCEEETETRFVEIFDKEFEKIEGSASNFNE